MDKTEPFPDWQRTLAEYEGRFISIYSQLTRSYGVTLWESAHDLIHEFHTDEWHDVEKEYKPRRGAPGPYILRAFRYFASGYFRERQKSKSRCSDLGEFADQLASEGAETPFDALAHEEELRLLDDALEEIPEARRIIVRDYFDVDRPSLRDLNEKYGITRKRVERLLINGFGQLVVRLRARDLFSSADRDVAIALWCDGLQVREVADQLGRPIEEIRETKKRLTKVMKKLLYGRRVARSGSSIDLSSCPKGVRNSIPKSVCSRE
jgi:RNA polymerase sigma factor (sigma-70 family)